MRVKEYEGYFNNNSELWLKGAYEKTEYEYPVGFHRVRVLKKILEKYDIKNKTVLDIGCGGGDVSLLLASQGAYVTGIDMSSVMLETAKSRALKLEKEIQEKVEFRYENFEELSDHIKNKKYDVVIAFGLIGYLESDELFFEIVDGITKKNSLLVVSCRNELFNMTSISNNTVNEINNNNAINLIQEINQYYQKKIDSSKAREFVKLLYNVCGHLLEEKEEQITEYKYEGLEMPERQPRQSTPQMMKDLATKYNYKLKNFYGIHPHLLLPRLNKKLPPRIFNEISDSLCIFEDEPISLIWSSVFIGEYLREE